MGRVGDYLPGKERDLRDWAVSFCGHLTATPTLFGVTAADASSLQALTDTFGELVAQTTDPATRTPALIGAKSTARRALVSSIRPLVQRIQTHPGLTLQQRIDLGINTRDNLPSPVHPPSAPPLIEVTKAVGHTLHLTVKAPGEEGRSKPEGAQGFTLFALVAPEASMNPQDYTCMGQSTRTSFEVQFPSTVAPGSRVWLTGVWYSPRGEYTEMSQPISAYIAGGLAAAPSVKLAGGQDLAQAA